MTLIHQRARHRLLAQGILVTNQDGDEVLKGLDVAETQYVFACAECDTACMRASEVLLYFQLRHRHLQARVDALFGGKWNMR